MKQTTEDGSELLGVVTVMLFGPVLEVGLFLVDLTLKPIPVSVYASIAVVAGTSAIAALIHLDSKKILPLIEGPPKPFYPSWVRALAWVLVLVVVSVTVRLALFKYRNSFGDVALLGGCVSSVTDSRQGRAIRRIEAESSQNFVLVYVAKLRDWVQPDAQIEAARVWQLHKEELPLSWNVGERTDSRRAELEVYDIRKPKKFQLETDVGSRIVIPDPCSTLEFSFETRPPAVRVIDLHTWHKYDVILVFELGALVAMVIRLFYVAGRNRSKLISQLRRFARRRL